MPGVLQSPSGENGTAGNAQRYNMLGSLAASSGTTSDRRAASVWATQEVRRTLPMRLCRLGADPSLITQGTTVFATLSYRLWAPEDRLQPAMFHK